MYHNRDTIPAANGEKLMSTALDTYITIRVNKTTHQNFMDRANKYGKPSDVLREIIDAFIDDRLVMYPNPSKESLYVVRTEN
jgi:hypothetical protein